MLLPAPFDRGRRLLAGTDPQVEPVRRGHFAGALAQSVHVLGEFGHGAERLAEPLVPCRHVDMFMSIERLTRVVVRHNDHASRPLTDGTAI
ncbi:hypothetical protein GCM10018966_038520 [Streptomyces yanii]